MTWPPKVTTNLDRFAQGPDDPQDITPEEEVFSHCDKCSEEIRLGEDYYEDVDGNIFCSLPCILKHYEVKTKIAGEG